MLDIEISLIELGQESDGNKVVKEIIFGTGGKKYRFCKVINKFYITFKHKKFWQAINVADLFPLMKSFYILIIITIYVFTSKYYSNKRQKSQ